MTASSSPGSTKSAPHIMIIAGEASGDALGAKLVHAVRELAPEAVFSGVGGRGMSAAGVEILHRASELSVVGFSGVLPKLGVILSALRKVKRHMTATRPSVAVLIDFPDFNFRVGKAAKKLGIKVLYYVCPQVWAWRVGRARTMASFVDRSASILPFETELLSRVAPELRTEYVGHPLLDDPPPQRDGPLSLPRGADLVGILPGSRTAEIVHILPCLLRAAGIMARKRKGLYFALPLAPGLKPEHIEPYLDLAPSGLKVIASGAETVMARAGVLLIASGTATLQAALAGAPMVVIYKTGALNFWMARRLIKVDFIAMPNLIAGREVLPELIQGAATPEAVAREGLAILDDGPQRREMLAGLELVRRRMGGPGASARVARMVLELAAER